MARSLLTLMYLLPSIFALQDPSRAAGRKGYAFGNKQPLHTPSERSVHEVQHVERAQPLMVVQNDKTKKFAVDGTAIPDVDFDIGESYAGLLPISSRKNETRKLYFWYFPTTNPDGKDDITIWLNGGPGCSSLEGLLQENGPFLWQYGTYKPVPNPYSWTNLTSMLWVEQPVGTGFSQGESTETNEEAVAESFLGFFKNFIDTFELKNKKIYITGESYAGMYVPYISDAMLNKEDKEYFDLQASMIYDPSVNGDIALEHLPAVAHVENHQSLYNLNATFMADIQKRASDCGYTQFLSEYLTFPPKGPLPNIPLHSGDIPASCRLWDDIFAAVSLTNPCFDIYDITTTCPVLWDVLGFPGSFDYLPSGASIYFNRTDVQKAINAPVQEWDECSNVALATKGDSSLPSALSVLPGVIERSKRTVIAHGKMDYVLLLNGTLLSIQNMTWSGQQGFQSKPSDPLFVPYHNDPSASTLAAAGVMGTTHEERGLTWNEVDLSGHMIPQYAPSVAYRQMEFLLGRIESLSELSPFTTQPDVAQPAAANGGGSYGSPSSAAPAAAASSGGMTVEQLFGLLNPSS